MRLAGLRLAGPDEVDALKAGVVNLLDETGRDFRRLPVGVEAKIKRFGSGTSKRAG